jgi:hypothetical protein
MNIFNRDMKNYKAQDEKAKTGELIAMAFVAFLFLVLLSWMTERDSFGMSETEQVASYTNSVN